MNLKTTIVLLVLIVLGALGWLVVGLFSPAPLSSATQAVLETELRPENITRVEILRGERRVVLEKGASGWSLPGKWPVRKPEVEQLVGILTNLRTRFAPIPASSSEELQKFGLGGVDVLQVIVKAGGKDYKLTFAEEPGQSSRFSRPTYLRLGEAAEVLRVAPGLIAALDRPQEHFMQRRLFPVERVAKEGGERGEKIEQLAGEAIFVQGKSETASASSYKLVRVDGIWEMREPVRDQVDPDKIKTILTSLPDIWVEKFVETSKKTLEEFGLKEPEQVLKITLAQGETITLLVGKTSEKRERIVQKPGASPFMPKPQVDFVKEEFKFAKLQDNDQIFEIKADKLKEVVVAAATLRDPQLARFKSEDVKKLTIDEGGRTLRFVKGDDGWKLEQPTFGVERSKIDELLDKLSGLRASDQDILDKADLKTHGLDQPARVSITVEEGKDKKTKEFTFLIGKPGDKGKLPVQVAGWDRVNLVEGDLLKLAQRPALAYRSRRVLNFSTSEAARIDVQREGEPYALEQSGSTWRLAAPVQAELDSLKADSLPRELSQLEAVEFITSDPKGEDLDKVHGLAKPAISIKVSFSDKKKPEQILQVGKKHQSKEEYYCRLGSDPTVFTIKKDTFETLNKDSLSYRPTELWKLEADDIAELRVQKGEEYVLKREGDKWTLSGPFSATVTAEQIRPITEELARPQVEKYVAHTARDLADRGLDNPYLRVAIKPGAKKDKDSKDKDNKQDTKERVLLIGKPVEKEAKTRYGRLADAEAIFVVGEKALAAVDRSALDLLDRKLLALDSETIQSLRTTVDKETFTLVKAKDGWRVETAGVAPFPADREVMEVALRAWSSLQAQKLVAYGDKVDLAKFGLDKPTAVITVTVQEKAEKEKPGKTSEHKLLLGSEVEGNKGAHYARVEGQPAVAVLEAAVVADLKHTPLDFVNRTVLKLDTNKVTALVRQRGSESLELVKKGESWRITKPADQPADESVLRTLTGELAALRANKVAAYPAKDLKPFGLDAPVATLTIRVEQEKDKTVDHVLQIGKLVAEKAGQDRHARLDKSDTVVILPGRVAEQLMAPPLQFRDRLLAKAPSVNKITLERGIRKVTFTQMGDTWKMTQPIEAEVEQFDLENLIKSFAELRADKLVAEKPADLKPHGLDRPQTVWKLFSAESPGGKDREMLTLLVGSKESAGQRVHVQVAGSDIVALLDDKLSGQVLAEYRSRKVWPSLDSFQVEKLTFGYEKGSFTLQKMGGDWQVAGKSGLKVKQDAVRDTLDALARLKAERWVVDKDANPKDFGLEPPTLALEVDTPSGKRTLKVGRQEGGSSRFYALVVGENNGAVFLIGEADARQIIRPLEAFLEKS